MNLTVQAALECVVKTMQDRIQPHLGDGYAGEMNRLAAIITKLAANALNDIAAVRMAEVRELRALFGDAAPLVDGPLRQRLEQEAGAPDPGLRISELDAAVAQARGLLVDLHAQVELGDSEQVRELNRRIWRILKDTELAQAPRP